MNPVQIFLVCQNKDRKGEVFKLIWRDSFFLLLDASENVVLEQDDVDFVRNYENHLPDFWEGETIFTAYTDFDDALNFKLKKADLKLIRETFMLIAVVNDPERLTRQKHMSYFAFIMGAVFIVVGTLGILFLPKVIWRIDTLKYSMGAAGGGVICVALALNEYRKFLKFERLMTVYQ